MYENLVFQCINGERPPTCGSCPANPVRGGECCFGVRHTYGDKDCSACVLEDRCAPRAHARPVGAPKVNVPPQPTRPVQPPGVHSAPKAPPVGAPRVTVLPGGKPPPGVEPTPIEFNPKDSLLVRLLKVVAYGVLWGAFVLGASFLDKRKPE